LTTLVIGATREIDRQVEEGGGPEKSGLFYWRQFRKDRTSTYQQSIVVFSLKRGLPIEINKKGKAISDPA
jgi:hypothetical protein